MAGLRLCRNWVWPTSRKKPPNNYVPTISFAYVYARLGMNEETIHNLQRAYEDHSPRLLHPQCEPDFDFLHSDERYREIVAKSWSSARVLTSRVPITFVLCLYPPEAEAKSPLSYNKN